MVGGEIQQSFILATFLLLFDVVLAVAVSIIAQAPIVSYVAASIAFIEIGVLLVVGGCLMARQPLDTKDRYTSDGTPTYGWRIAVIGRRLLVAAVFLFPYAGLLSLIGLAIGF
ncbi:MAG: hypothetical protein ACFFER_05615 [Candidatus Thorarchaeota archaeon]